MQNLLKSTRFFPRNRAALGLILLLAAGYLGNYFRWSFFFDIDFLFGSIAVWIVACLYGTAWGTVAAFIAGFCTYVIWHHPFTIITFTLEGFFVGFLFHKYRQNIVLLDGIFWLTIGMPLVWLFYAIVQHVDPVQARIILFKQPVNGIFNALIASLAIAHLPIHKWVNRPQAISTLSLQQTVFNLLVAFVFFPTLILMVLDSRQVIDNINTAAKKDLNAVSTDLVVEIRSWYQQHLQVVSELAQVATKSDLRKLDVLQQSTEFTKQLSPDLRGMYVVDTEGKALTSSSSLNLVGKSTSGLNLYKKSYFKDIKNTLTPKILDVMKVQGNASPRIILSVPIVKANRPQGFAIAELDLSSLNQLLQSNHAQHGLQITLVDRHKSVIASTQSERVAMQAFDRRKHGEVHEIEPGIYQWFPTTGSPLVLVRWSESFFVQESTIDDKLPWMLIVELSATPHVQYIVRVNTKNLAILIGVAAIALVFATLISRQLVQSLSKLAQTTTNLPNKLLEREPIDWPHSSVTEIDSLIRNFKWMSASLNQKFIEIKTANERLEQRVQERTQELLKINQALELEITERQRTEDKLRAYTLKLEQSNRELQDFAFVASHDLQEPLRKIQAFGDRLKLKYQESLSDEGRDYLERMQKAAHRMQTLINDLLAFSRVTTKAQPFVPVNLGNVLQEVLSDLEVHIQKVGGKIEIGSLPTLDADPSQMRQLLQNLISNALKFHRNEEAPIVKVWGRCLDTHGESDVIKLSADLDNISLNSLLISNEKFPLCQICQIIVEDNGIGFDEKYADRIFTVFQRLHGRNEYEGTGVGLAICRKIVERHRGTITAKSTPGSGTKFIVTLPVSQPQSYQE